RAPSADRGRGGHSGRGRRSSAREGRGDPARQHGPCHPGACRGPGARPRLPRGLGRDPGRGHRGARVRGGRSHFTRVAHPFGPGGRLGAGGAAGMSAGGAPEALTPAALQGRLRAAVFGHRVFYYPTIGSTNDKALDLAAAGEPEGAVVLAEEQTGGRGRRERTWDSPERLGDNGSLVLCDNV